MVSELEMAGIDVRAAVRDGRYVMRDAADTLSSFVRNGSPDPELFASGVDVLMADVRARAKSSNRGLTVFGEMVAVLWEDGQKQAALRPEDIWNAALGTAPSTCTARTQVPCSLRRTIFALSAPFIPTPSVALGLPSLALIQQATYCFRINYTWQTV